MDFWKVFDEESMGMSFGSKQLTLNTNPRHNLSLKGIEDRSIDLIPDSCVFIRYSDERRYITVKNLAFDMLIILFDVNASSTVALRTSMDITRKDLSKISRIISKMKNPNIEVRVLGLQNNHTKPVQVIYKIRKMQKGILAEADMFGDNLRHITIDTKTGMVYDALLLNRVYRPGELANTNGQASDSGAVALKFIFPDEIHAGSHK